MSLNVRALSRLLPLLLVLDWRVSLKRHYFLNIPSYILGKLFELASGAYLKFYGERNNGKIILLTTSTCVHKIFSSSRNSLCERLKEICPRYAPLPMTVARFQALKYIGFKCSLKKIASSPHS